MRTQLKHYQTLLAGLSQWLRPFVEASIYSKSSGELLWQTDALSPHTDDQQLQHTNVSEQMIMMEQLNNQKMVKSLYIPIDDYVIRLRCDVSQFAAVQDLFNSFYKTAPQVALIDNDWQEMIDKQINQFLQQQKTSLAALSLTQKRELVHKLYASHCFNYKSAAKYISAKLNVSRATLYNYVQQANLITKVKIYQVDTFTNEKCKGNPAGVVLDAEKLNEPLMKSIAKELNLSETSFIFPSKRADFCLRYFTPNGHEVKFCGHSSVGALYMLAKSRCFAMHKNGCYQFKVETLAGIIDMSVTIKDENIVVKFYAPMDKLTDVEYSHKDFLQAVGGDINQIDTSTALSYEQLNQDLYIHVKNLSLLQQLKLDIKKLRKFAKSHDIVSFCFVTTETYSPNNHLHVRCFAPTMGIEEDLFTGSVLGGLIAYANHNQLIDQQRNTINVEQGHFLNRPGQVMVRYWHQNNRLRCEATAQAILFSADEITLT